MTLRLAYFLDLKGKLFNLNQITSFKMTDRHEKEKISNYSGDERGKTKRIPIN